MMTDKARRASSAAHNCDCRHVRYGDGSYAYTIECDEHASERVEPHTTF